MTDSSEAKKLQAANESLRKEVDYLTNQLSKMSEKLGEEPVRYLDRQVATAWIKIVRASIELARQQRRRSLALGFHKDKVVLSLDCSERIEKLDFGLTEEEKEYAKLMTNKHPAAKLVKEYFEKVNDPDFGELRIVVEISQLDGLFWVVGRQLPTW